LTNQEVLRFQPREDRSRGLRAYYPGSIIEDQLEYGGFLSPPLRRGFRAESNKAALPQEFGATGEVKHLLQDIFDLLRLRAVALAQRARAASVSKVAFHFLERREIPSSKEGISNHQRWQQPLAAVATIFRRYRG
jgi:hypothetical protein